MDAEALGYKQKVEQMSVLIKHYQNELESQKIRRDGVETVSRLLTEARQENSALKKALMTMETSMKNLKNRMTVNGISVETDAEDTEVIVPGTSRQTLTNLAMENKRLRSMLQHDSGGSTDSVSDSDSLQKPAKVSEGDQSLQQTVDRLQVENKSLKMKVSDLESLYRSSNNDKDRHLLSLHQQVQQLKDQDAGDTTKAGTMPQLSALKEQLRAFMSQCQDFESILNQMPETSEVVMKQAVERAEGDSVDGGLELKEVQEEKQKLQDRVEEVTKMNQRWQEFFSERSRYTQGLEQRVQELDGRLKEAMRQGPSQEIQRRIQQVLEKSQKEVAQMDELRQKAEDEAQALHQELAERQAQISQLQSQVTILSQSPGPAAMESRQAAEARGTIEHLKFQIQVCTEDFEKERQDRQVALQKVSTLQAQVNQLTNLNNQLQTVIQNQQQQQQQAPMAPQASYASPPHPHQLPPPRPSPQEHGHSEGVPSQNLQPRGALFRPPGLDFDYDCPRSPESNTTDNDNTRGSSSSSGWRDYPDFDFEVAGSSSDLHHPHPHPSAHCGLQQGGPLSLPPGSMVELIARGTPQPQPLSDSALGDSASSSSAPPQQGSAKQNILTCPKCNKEFSEEHQTELLAHMDVCWE